MASPPISFGPQDQQWHYDPSTKTYDLSSPSSSKLTIQTTTGAAGVSISIDPKSTALVVVDMQNFFLDERCITHPLGLSAVQPTIAVIDKCRELGIQVIWLNWGLTDTDMQTMPAAVLRGFSKRTLHSTPETDSRLAGLGSDLGDSKGRCLFAGSWNAEIYPPLAAHVHSSDIHCAKNRMSGLWHPSQPLWKALVEEEKRTLLFTGVNTDQCVLGTIQDAYNAGWNCVLVDDCCGTTTEGGKEVTLHNVANSYGFVTDSKYILGCRVG